MLKVSRGETTNQDFHRGAGVDIYIFPGDGRRRRAYNSYAHSVGEGAKNARGLVRKSKEQNNIARGMQL
jgi:hypothetical protein